MDDEILIDNSQIGVQIFDSNYVDFTDVNPVGCGR